MEHKPVLDVCCGSRMFWFNKNDTRALYIDNREGTRKADVGTPSTKGRSDIVVSPDMIADFRNLPFDSDTFYHVVFDPPHHTPKVIGSGKTGILPFKYGDRKSVV